MTVTPSRAVKICPVCNSTTRNFFDINHYNIRRCQVCAHQFIDMEPGSKHVDEVYDDAYFQGKKGAIPTILVRQSFLKSKGNAMLN